MNAFPYPRDTARVIQRGPAAVLADDQRGQQQAGHDAVAHSSTAKPGCDIDMLAARVQPSNIWNPVERAVVLRHVLVWEQALAEAVRVLRPGGPIVVADLLANAPLRLLHEAEGADFRLLTLRGSWARP
jgi:hypothetical protein